MSGLLIINADDWGAAPATTDAIRDTYRAGAITSTTAMVWMADDERAARIALEDGLPVGLHLNLTHAFDGGAVPAAARERQRRLARSMSRSPTLTRWAYRPLLRRQVDTAIAEQLERFGELYGGPPSHVDGHHHVHMSPNVLRSRSLADVAKLRTSHDRDARRSPANLPRAARRRLIGRRFLTTESFFSIRELHPRLGGSGLEAALELSRTRSVEVMVHPAWEDEYELLLSPEWRAALEGLPLGSYRELGGTA